MTANLLTINSSKTEFFSRRA